jgi:hypothetical protein
MDEPSPRTRRRGTNRGNIAALPDPPAEAQITSGGLAVPAREAPAAAQFEVPVSMLGPLFHSRLQRIHRCRVPFQLEISNRATKRVLGGYYRIRRLVRIYVRDQEFGQRPLEELFDTFLHEVAHHLEYTEPTSFSGRRCGRRPGRMHSRLFWRILGELKYRWAELQRNRPR